MSSAFAPTAARSIIYLGMDVHKDSITIAVLPASAKTPTRLERLPNYLAKRKRLLDRLVREGELRACYEASGAGYVLHRALREWDYACEVVAPLLIPKRPGVQRKHDKRDACELARLYRAGELTPVRIPSEAEERVRDVVRWPASMNGPARSRVDSLGVLRSSSGSLVDTRPNDRCQNTEQRHPAVPGNEVLPMLPVYSVTYVPGRSRSRTRRRATRRGEPRK